jgi:hypothetical protein
MEDKEKYKTIATKVSAEQKRQLDCVLKRLGTNEYQWFQVMAEVTIRMADDRHNLSEDMSKIIQIFEMLPGWKSPVSFFDPNAKSEIDSACYFITQRGKPGMKPVLVERGWMGRWQMEENAADIVEFVLEKAMPKSYWWLRQRMAERDCNRVFEYLLKLADDAKAEQLNADICEMFGDNSRHEFGGNIEYGARTKRVKHRSPEEYIEQKTLHFDEVKKQSEEAKKWLEENAGDERPFCHEW